MAAEYEVNIKINTQQIERELKKVDKAVNNIGKGKGGKKQPILALPSTDQLSAATRKIKELDGYNRKIHLTQKQINKQTRDQALSIDTLVKTQEKRARLLNKINEMEAKGLNVSKLRKQLAKATTEQSARRFGSAEKEFRVLEKSIRLEQSKLRILKEQRKGFPSSPVRGTRTMMGSPAQIAAAGRQIASPIRGGLNFPGSPAFLAGATASRTPLGPAGSFPQALGGLPTGGAALPIRGSTAIPGSPKAIQAAKATELRAAQVQGSWSKALGQLQETAGVFKERNAQVKRSWTKALGQLQETAKDISQNRATRRGKRRRERLEQVGLGAGFPLLFGGGAGSVIGGGLGGLTGSFGAQIAFSAIGQQIDQFVASMVEAGKAFTSVSGAADFMAEKSLFSSDAMQFRIEKLIEEGEVSRAAALMTQEMAKQVGGSGLKALKDLGTEANKMGKLFGTLILQIQAFIAKGLAPLLNAINTVVGNVVTNNKFNVLMEEATGDRAREINEFLKPYTTKIGGQGGRSTRTRVTQEGKRLAVEKFGGQVIPEGAAIEPTQLELLRAADTQSSQGEREEARIQKRLGKLEEERKKILEVSRFKDKIAAAEMSRDEQLVIRLKGEQKIAEIEAKRKQNLVDITDQRLIDQININAATEKLAAVRDIERELAEFDRERNQQRLDDMQKFIEQQYELNEAVKQQAALTEGIAQAMGQGMTESFDLLINGAENWGAALQDIAANVLRDIARQLIQIYIIEQAVGFLRAYLTPFAAGTPLGAGGGQVGRFGTLGPNYGIPQFADGGNPPVGRPSIVGERGPELFVPRTAGTIIPNHAMGSANVTVNVDASGSSVEGESDQAAQLGKMLGAAVQAELVKQKRPGGLLAS